MEAKFTKGPWGVREHGVQNLYNVVAQHAGIASVALWESGEPGNDVEALANAHLIATAPEMYEALNDALGELEALRDAPDSDYARPDETTIIDLDRVLAKARGEA